MPKLAFFSDAHGNAPVFARRIVNSGSCGMPRDRRDQASFALYESATDTVEIDRLGFDPVAVLDGFPSGDVADETRALFLRGLEGRSPATSGLTPV